jgi:hypothetical protein
LSSRLTSSTTICAASSTRSPRLVAIDQDAANFAAPRHQFNAPIAKTPCLRAHAWKRFYSPSSKPALSARRSHHAVQCTPCSARPQCPPSVPALSARPQCMRCDRPTSTGVTSS